MCNSAAEGGQRCHSHNTQALAAAEAKYATLKEDVLHHFMPEAYAQFQHSRYDLADARARYASTPQGEVDIAARMDALTVKGKAPGFADDGDDEYEGYALALSEGVRLRARAKDLHNAVRTGILTGPQAADLAAYPTPHAISIREAVITGALNCRNGDISAAERGSAEPEPFQPPPELETSAACPTCDGGGETSTNPTWNRDPQFDESRTCYDCGGTGHATPDPSDPS